MGCCTTRTSQSLLEGRSLLLGCSLLLRLNVVEIALGLGARHKGLRRRWLRYLDWLDFVSFEALLVWD